MLKSLFDWSAQATKPLRFVWHEYAIRDALIDTFLRVDVAEKLLDALGGDSIHFGIEINGNKHPQTLEVSISRMHNRHQELAEQGQKIIEEMLHKHSPHTKFVQINIVDTDQSSKSPFKNTLWGIRAWEDAHSMKRLPLSEIVWRPSSLQ